MSSVILPATLVAHLMWREDEERAMVAADFHDAPLGCMEHGKWGCCAKGVYITWKVGTA
jgi:hypothetical protein